MPYVALTVEIHCVSTSEGAPAYRVYVDNDLLTERTWRWPAHEIYICEKIAVNVEPGTHRLKIQELVTTGCISIQNFTVNGNTIDSQDLSFVI